MTKQQRTILTVVLSLVVVAAAVGGGILGIQGSRANLPPAANEAKTPMCPPPAAPPTTVPPPMAPPSGSGPSAESTPAPPAPSTQPAPPAASQQAQGTTSPASEPTAKSEEAKAPSVRFMEIGAEWCGPCRSMKPIIEALKKEYKGKVEFVAIDIDKDKAAASKYNVSAIPVQLIFQNDKQMFRHVGSISKEDIVAQFKKLGVTPAS
ncbi:MAG: thioredoxin family protein [Armatimonadota bacterium]